MKKNKNLLLFAFTTYIQPIETISNKCSVEFLQSNENTMLNSMQSMWRKLQIEM